MFSAGRCRNLNYIINYDTCKCYKVSLSLLFGQSEDFWPKISWRGIIARFQYYQGSTTNYNQSAQQCASDGGTMAIILTQADNTFVSSLAKNSSVTETNPWIGLWCSGNTPSSCRWADGSPVSYTNFAGGMINFRTSIRKFRLSPSEPARLFGWSQSDVVYVRRLFIWNVYLPNR